MSERLIAELNPLVYEIRAWSRWLESHTLTIVIHPDDVTDEVREEIARYPLTQLRESTLTLRGEALLIDPEKVLA